MANKTSHHSPPNPPILYMLQPSPQTSETASFPLALLLLLPFLLRSIEIPIEDGLNVRINVREGAIWCSSLPPAFILQKGSPPPAAAAAEGFPKGPDCGTPRSRSFFAPKIDDAKEVSEGPNDMGPLCNASNWNPTDPS